MTTTDRLPAATLHERVRRIRSRLAIRSWEYRQRHLARGVWTRLARLLADTERAYSVTEEDASRLRASGALPVPLGAELEPPKELFVVTPEAADALSSRRRLPVRLGPEMLAARHVVLVAFPEREP